MSTFTWGTVTSLAPLRVQLDGDTAPIPFSLDSLIDPAMLSVSDRVRIDMGSRHPVIVGRMRGTGLLSGRNRIINGNFRTNQRGYVSGAPLALGQYSFDRWRAFSAFSGLTFAPALQGQKVTLPPAGGFVGQFIERANIEPGQYTLSWSGSALGSVSNVGASPTYLPSPVTVTLDGLSDVMVIFYGEGWDVGEVQLERGSTPTPFERIPVGEELALCQRYYQRISAGARLEQFGLGYQLSTTAAAVTLALPCSMRILPTLGFNALVWSDRVALEVAVSSVAIAQSISNSSNVVSLTLGFAASGAVYRPGVLRADGAASYLSFDSEL
jgi:hypothetical protein